MPTEDTPVKSISGLLDRNLNECIFLSVKRRPQNLIFWAWCKIIYLPCSCLIKEPYHLHISHKTPCLPPKILHCFSPWNHFDPDQAGKCFGVMTDYDLSVKKKLLEDYLVKAQFLNCSTWLLSLLSFLNCTFSLFFFFPCYYIVNKVH